MPNSRFAAGTLTFVLAAAVALGCRPLPVSAAGTPSEFRAGAVGGVGQRLRGERNGPLSRGPSARRGRPVGRAVRGLVSLVRRLLCRSRLSGRRAVVSALGIVYKNRSDFARHSTMQGALPNGVVGYYDRNSNRINLYDMGERAEGANWRRNAAVLIHEATHQMAFNTGVHSRFCPPPTWLAEGLAMLFEAPGVHDRATTRNCPIA